MARRPARDRGAPAPRPRVRRADRERPPSSERAPRRFRRAAGRRRVPRRRRRQAARELRNDRAQRPRLATSRAARPIDDRADSRARARRLAPARLASLSGEDRSLRRRRPATSAGRSTASRSSACASSPSTGTRRRPGWRSRDVGEAVDFSDAEAVAEVGRKHAVDGVDDDGRRQRRPDRRARRRAARPAGDRLRAPRTWRRTRSRCGASSQSAACRSRSSPRCAGSSEMRRPREDGRLPGRTEAGRLGGQRGIFLVTMPTSFGRRCSQRSPRPARER